MELWAPRYYQNFKCIADKCTHSCCVGWEIDVDEKALARYRAMQGELGKALLESIVEDGESAHFALCRDGRCPHLDGRGLCRVITALGEGALPDICREHPRFYNRVGDRLECGIGASCEEAARLILTSRDYTCIPIAERDFEQDAPASDFDVIAARDEIVSLLADRGQPLARREREIAARCTVDTALSRRELRSLKRSLEYLDGRHKRVLGASMRAKDIPATDEAVRERFLAYLLYRHTAKAENRREFEILVGAALFLSRIFAALLARGYSPVDAAVLLSEELEYSEENFEEVRFAVEIHNL